MFAPDPAPLRLPMSRAEAVASMVAQLAEARAVTGMIDLAVLTRFGWDDADILALKDDVLAALMTDSLMQALSPATLALMGDDIAAAAMAATIDHALATHGAWDFDTLSAWPPEVVGRLWPRAEALATRPASLAPETRRCA